MTAVVIERAVDTETVSEEELLQLEQLWENPSMEWDGDDSEREEWVIIAFVGFAYAAALAYAAYCTSTGGSADIGFSFTRGFWVKCTR